MAREVDLTNLLRTHSELQDLELKLGCCMIFANSWLNPKKKNQNQNLKLWCLTDEKKGLLVLELVLPGERFRNQRRGLFMGHHLRKTRRVHCLHSCLRKMQSVWPLRFAECVELHLKLARCWVYRMNPLSLLRYSNSYLSLFDVCIGQIKWLCLNVCVEY